MNIFFMLSGLISEIFLYCVFLYSKKMVPGFDLKTKMISDLGNYKKSGIILHSGLVIYTILRYFFISSILNTLHLWSNIPILLITSLAFLFTAIVAVIPVSKNKVVHEISGYSFLIFSILFIILMGFYLLSISFFLSLSSLIVASCILLVLLYAIKKKRLNGYFELNVFYLIIIWDILFTLKLFNFFF